MIDKKEISKASAAHAKATWNHDEEQFSCMDGFEAGVDWAQKEFKKSLWHEADEEPQKNKFIVEKIVELDGVSYDTDILYGNVINWKERTKRYDIVSWCYIDDILPKEEKQK